MYKAVKSDKFEKIERKVRENATVPHAVGFPSLIGNQACNAGIAQCCTAPVRVNYTRGKAYENAALNQLIDSNWTLLDVQVPIIPNPTPAIPAPRRFIADFYMRDPSGTEFLIEAKYTAGGGDPRLTINQSKGYPAVAAAGGTIPSGPRQGPLPATPGILMHN